ncbi:MAG: RNA-directed DNA polymerase [Myxococcota bacterium]
MTTGERIGLDELYYAYRKAKHYAFRDPNSPQGFIYSDYEERLSKNLRSLHKRLNRADARVDAELVGGWAAIPRWTDGEQPRSHFFSSDPELMWNLSHSQVKYRLIGTASVDMQVVNAIWCMSSGARIDAALNHEHVFASHPHRGGLTRFASGLRLSTSRPLFQHWASQYERWQRQGLRRMRGALREDRKIVALTMDVQRFYHRLDASFLTSRNFQNAPAVPPIEFSGAEAWLNQFLLQAIETWIGLSPAEERRGLPVGWTSSAVIANAALRSFDQRVLQSLSPVYYGRYVDDVFLVAEPHRSFSSASEVMEWLGERLELTKVEGDAPAWHVDLPELGRSLVAFGEMKQKVFCLEGEAGLDLVRPIEDAIRHRASEFRALPVLPTDDDRVAASALLTTNDASIEADALRKADAISVRRHSFALILKRVSEYRQHIEPASWRDQRRAFFGVVRRHVLTPRGVAELSGYLPRLFSLAASTSDWKELWVWVRTLVRVRRRLNAGGENKKNPDLARRGWHNLWSHLAESVVTGTDFGELDEASSLFARLLRLARRTGPEIEIAWRKMEQADWLLRPRLGRRRLHDTTTSPRWPKHLVPDGLAPLHRLNGDRGFTSDSMMLATRVPDLPELHRIDLAEETDPEATLGALAVLKYGRMSEREFRVRKSGKIRISGDPRGRVRLFVASLLTDDSDWRAATHGLPALGAARFDKLRKLIGRVIEDVVHSKHREPPYLLLPELSLPQAWASFFAAKLAAAGISLIAGLEYRRSPGGDVINEGLLSFCLPGWGRRSFILLQRKRRPAWHEAKELRQAVGLSLATSSSPFPVYVHGDLHLSVIICSDFTDAQARTTLAGKVDLVVVPEWNKDIDGFSTLVEAASLDVHAFIAQINNRAFGDSRVRVAAEKSWERDLVRLRGGRDDFYSTVDVDYHRLRKFQANAEPAGEGFKPFPVGFTISKGRRRI